MALVKLSRDENLNSVEPFHINKNTAKGIMTALDVKQKKSLMIPTSNTSVTFTFDDATTFAYVFPFPYSLPLSSDTVSITTDKEVIVS